MAVYLKEFETQAAYEAAQSGLILPNVSLTVDNNTVHYNSSSPVPPTPSHDYVEIAGIKWATMNVGANSITDRGLYFQWGDTQGYTDYQVGSSGWQKYFGWADYKYNPSGDALTMTKYNSTDGLTVLEASDDAVTVAWGSGWRMPTTAEFQALGNAVNTAWTSSYNSSGVAGMVCTDKTDSSKVLFFPTAGYCTYGSVNGEYNAGLYWSSSLQTSRVQSAYNLSFGSGYVTWDNNNDRTYGCSVRPVIG